MTVVNPYARKPQKSPSDPRSTGMMSKLASSEMSNKPNVKPNNKSSSSKGPLPRPPPLPLSTKSKENLYPRASINKPLTSSSSFPLAVSGQGDAAASKRTPTTTTTVLAPKTTSLKQELAALKQEQKLQMERIRQQIEAKKQRKLLRKLQKKQQILQATMTGNEGSNDASSSSATTEKHLALDHCLVGADTAASAASRQNLMVKTTAAAVDPAPFDDMFSTESNLDHVAAFEDKNHGVVSNNHKNASFSSPTSSDLWMNCEPIEYNPYRATTTSHAPARMPQALNYYDHQGYAMQYYNFQQQQQQQSMYYPYATMPNHHLPWTTTTHHHPSYPQSCCHTTINNIPEQMRLQGCNSRQYQRFKRLRIITTVCISSNSCTLHTLRQ